MVSKPSGRLLDLISLPDEPWLEKYARYFRFHAILPKLRQKIVASTGDLTIVDYGCGQDILFYKFLSFYFPDSIHRISYVGIDPLISPKKSARITLLREKFENANIVPKADVIAMFAVLEHVDDPEQLLRAASTKLKAEGLILATTPSWIAKPVLEFLSSVMGIISIREIQEHKQYFSKQSVSRLVTALGRTDIRWRHWYFECGMNNGLYVEKASVTRSSQA